MDLARAAASSQRDSRLSITGLVCLTVLAGTLLFAAQERIDSAEATSSAAPASPDGLASSRGDFNADLRGDLLWRHMTSADASIWLMNGINAPTTGPISLPGGVSLPDLNWRVQALGDHGGDGKADILWRNATSGSVVVWSMNGFARDSAALLGTQSDLMQAIRGAADFNADGKVDLLWRHESTDALQIWFSGGSQPAISPTPGLAWTFQGLGDFDGDNKADIRLCSRN